MDSEVLGWLEALWSPETTMAYLVRSAVGVVEVLLGHREIYLDSAWAGGDHGDLCVLQEFCPGHRRRGQSPNASIYFIKKSSVRIYPHLGVWARH